MYLLINGSQYTVSRRIKRDDTLKFLDVTTDPGEVNGVISMYRDDGFLLSQDNTADYTRQEYSNHVYILTNQPKPEPMPYIPSDRDILNVLLGLNNGGGV